MAGLLSNVRLEGDGDDVPLAVRSRALLLADRNRKLTRATATTKKDWPGLPRGVQFNPGDDDLLWHLNSKINNAVDSHPFIGEFIKYFDDDKCFDCTHPEKLPGVKLDGSACYFFHKRAELCDSIDGKHLSWEKIGKSIPLMLDGHVSGFKSIFVQHMKSSTDIFPFISHWMMYRYHVDINEDEKGIFVVSKIFCELKARGVGHAHQLGSRLEESTLDFMEKNQLIHENRDFQDLPEKNSEYQEIDIGGTRTELPKDRLEDDELDFLTLKERYEMLRRRSPGLRNTSLLESVRTVQTECIVCETKSVKMVGMSSQDVDKLQEIGTGPLIMNARNESDVCHQHNCQPLSGDCFGRNHLDSCSFDFSGNTIFSSPSRVITDCHEGMGDGHYEPAVLLPAHKGLSGNCNLTVYEQLRPIKDERYEDYMPSASDHPDSSFGQSDCTVVKNSKQDCYSRLQPVEEVTSSSYLCPPRKSRMAPKSCSVKVKKPTIDSMPSPLDMSKHCVSYSDDVPEFSEKFAKVKCEVINEDTASMKQPTNQMQVLLGSSIDTASGKDINDKMPLVHSTDVSADTMDGTKFCQNRRRKRKRTATDSIKTALDEDAPGLVEILLSRGITMEEIKLYSSTEIDELADISADSDFQDLETVMMKLFAERVPQLKLTMARRIKGERPVYCLACLISLIEQARYFQFCGKPVEWGWCRDVLSFVFVFRSHNRIVLERPEYGYATYFFEIVQSLPVEWQIRRLVIAMKLSNCSRSTLMENKPLVVGQDLSEGEARVLEEYGWTPNTGLGTMVNYCDRVYHDRKTEMCISEWRGKIGCLLMDGYDGGQMILPNLPNHAIKYAEDEIPEIKIEDI